MKTFFVRSRRAAFWLAWPFWFVYFRVVSDRTRLLVVADGKLLAVRSWLDGESWGLPGGGAKRGEPLRKGAIRELREETGILAKEGQLKELGNTQRQEFGLRYTAHYFLLRLDTAEQTKRQFHEIADVEWVSPAEIQSMNFNHDAQYGLDQYQDLLWQ